MPLSATERERLCCETLNTFMFQHVWNEPESEYRINIKPVLVKRQSVVGSFSVFDRNITLPTAGDSYYVWAIAAENFNLGLKLPTATWVDTATICNDWNTLIQMYTHTGVLFSKGSVYLRYNQSRAWIYIAVAKRMVTRCQAVSDIDSVYLTVYYDSDRTNDVSVLSVYMGKDYPEQEVHRKITSFLETPHTPDQVQYFLNGQEIVPSQSFPNMVNGDHIDVLIDTNIVCAFDIDLAADSENPVFLSTRDATWKQLLHIPKACNPLNRVITHNTCDFFIRKKFDTEKTGRYVHRAAGRRSVSQVTHNDMAMPLFIVDAYRDALGAQEVTIHGVVRIHEKDNVLIRDASYIDLLYTHDDAKIIDILVGKHASEITWWRAAELEQSAYVNMMFDVPNVLTTDTMKEYVAALGFYQIAGLLCRRVVDTILTDAFTGTLTFGLPILYTGMRVIPLVYLNGKIISMQYTRYSVQSDNTCTITIDPLLVTRPGDMLTVIFFVDGDRTIISFTPTAESLSVQVPYTDADVFLRHESTQLWQGVSQTSNASYQLLALGTNDYIRQVTDTGLTLVFNEKYIGQTFLIQSAYCSYRQAFDLAEYTATGKTLALPIQDTITGTAENVPLLNTKNVSVYLNGTYLVRDIDYFINTITDDRGYIAFRELVIQTMDHFREGQNDIVDVLFNIAEIEDSSSGFVIEDQLRDATPVNLYFDALSTVHVAGALVRTLDYKGTYIQLPKGSTVQGDLFEIQTAVPRLVKDFIQQYAANTDAARLAALNAYFYGHTQIVPDRLVLEGKHRIYSTMLNAFIYDTVNGVLPVVDDPDTNRMKEQIKPYLYLQEMDLCFRQLDTRFLDYYPQYVNYAVPPNIKRLVDKYIALFMPMNEAPTEEVVYE